MLFDAQWIYRDGSTRTGGRTDLRWARVNELTHVFPDLPAGLAGDPRISVCAAWDGGELLGGAIEFLIPEQGGTLVRLRVPLTS